MIKTQNIALVGKNITFGYDKNNLIFNDFSFSIYEKELNLIVGQNGAGKSTLLKIILGFLKPLSGKIITDKKLSYTPQHTSLNNNISITAYDVIMMGFLNSMFSKVNKIKVKNEIVKACEKLEISLSILSKDYRHLSGGQKQKVLICRSIVGNSDIILLDEPFSNIDQDSFKTISKSIENIDKTVVVVSHIPIKSNFIISI